jgi:hypothetical protein
MMQLYETYFVKAVAAIIEDDITKFNEFYVITQGYPTNKMKEHIASISLTEILEGVGEISFEIHESDNINFYQHPLGTEKYILENWKGEVELFITPVPIISEEEAALLSGYPYHLNIKNCKWCEKEFGKSALSIRDYYDYEKGWYCKKCVNKLDLWSERNWEDFYKQEI